MKDGPHIARIAALIGDSARAEVLTALMADRALTATELADIAGVTKQTISAHLAKLLDAGLIAVESQGRHRYFRLADRDVAHLLESLMNVAFRAGAVRLRASPREPALRRARMCYDHLAGEVGVQFYEALVRQGMLQATPQGTTITPAGARWFAHVGIDTSTLAQQRRMVCRPCLDWSERRHHLGGALGAALLQRLFDGGWAQRAQDSRVVHFTPKGELALRQPRTMLNTLLLFIATALAEIVGCYLPWLWLKQGKPAWLLLPAAASLALFAWLLTLHDTAGAGRVYAAYGGVYIGVALVWLWAVDGIRPTPWDVAGVLVALAGMAIIMLQPAR
eukprot:gene304-307_t